MIQEPTFPSIPVELEQVDPHETEGLSACESAPNVTDVRRAVEVARPGLSKNESQLKEEALLNAVIEIEALIVTAAQVTNERSEQGSGVRSEIEVLRRTQEQRIGTFSEDSDIPADVLPRLTSDNSSESSTGLGDLAQLGVENAFHIIAQAFDDRADDVRNAAARALFELQPDRVASFARTLREGSPDRRRRIGAAIGASGLAGTAIDNLAGQTRDQGYEAFSLLFLMTKAGEFEPLVRAVEDHPNIEVRLAVVRLLALNGQPEIVPSFRQLAVRGVLPAEVRTAVIEAIYELSRQLPRDILPVNNIP